MRTLRERIRAAYLRWPLVKFRHRFANDLTGGLLPDDRRRRDALRLAVQRHVAIPLDAHVGRLDDPPWRYWNVTKNRFTDRPVRARCRAFRELNTCLALLVVSDSEMRATISAIERAAEESAREDAKEIEGRMRRGSNQKRDRTRNSSRTRETREMEKETQRGERR
jgi:hypothetical protein